MSIRQTVNELVSQGRLICLPSLLLGEETFRTIYTTPELLRDVMPPFATDNDGYRLAEFRSYLDAFTEGAELSVAERPFNKPSDAMLARVNPVEDEIWDMRSVSPTPGIRALGAFIDQDEFVLLTWEFRENLDEQGAWSEEIDRFKSEWINLFGSLRPFQGVSLDAYLSLYYAV